MQARKDQTQSEFAPLLVALLVNDPIHLPTDRPAPVRPQFAVAGCAARLPAGRVLLHSSRVPDATAAFEVQTRRRRRLVTGERMKGPTRASVLAVKPTIGSTTIQPDLLAPQRAH